jgi:DNA modification methylase
MKPYYQEGKPGKTLTIYNGDCREILPQLGIYDLVLTDPPYGVGIEYDGYDDSERNLFDVVLMAFPLIRASGVVTLLTPGNGNQYRYPEPDWTLAWWIPGAVTRGSWGFLYWQPILAYGKDPSLREGKGCMSDGFQCNEASESNGHPTPKPYTLWHWLMRRGATRSTDTIIDPFLGSGTTLLCAKELGHEAVGIEQSEKYCEIAAKRLRQGVLF